MTRQVLLIEDEPEIADLLQLHLEQLGVVVIRASDGQQGLVLAQQAGWDLILLDLSLPGCDGLTICQRVRLDCQTTPIILLTARDTESDRVRGLDCGADDYVTKPFSLVELMARVKSTFRRQDAINDVVKRECSRTRIKVRDIVMDTSTHRTVIDGRPVNLTAKEFDLLRHFAQAPGEVFNREELLDKVWGHNFDGYLHTVNTHINRLRRKIEPDPSSPSYITTVWGVGYRLTP